MGSELYKLEWQWQVKTIQSGISSSINKDVFMDTILVCQDGVITHNKLVLGLLFPELTTVSVFDSPMEQTIMMPDHTITDIQTMILDMFPDADMVKEEDIVEPSDHSDNSNNLVINDNNFEHFLDNNSSDTDTAQPHQFNNQFSGGQPHQFGMRRGRGRPPLGTTAKLPPRFRCDYCNKGFFYRSMLTQHEKLHTGGSRETCNLCGAEYSTRQNLKNHMIKHHGEDSYTPRKRGRPPLIIADKTVTPSSSLTGAPHHPHQQRPLRPHYRGRGRPPLMTRTPGKC